jgi:AbiJ N-terminal domain 4
MIKFSDRLGLTQAPQEIQIDSMNDDLRTSLWNWVVEVIQYDGGKRSVPTLWRDYFKKPLDILSPSDISNLAWLRNHFMGSEWHEPYNVVEFIFQEVLPLHKPYGIATYGPRLDKVLERELSGYRLINSQLVPISDKQEIESIRQAMSEPAAAGLQGASEHIRKALTLLGKRPEADYANSIKESISAVESTCKLLTGEKSGGIDKALAKLSDSTSLHPALKQAFSKLYGYTSDEDGIRHAILETPDVGFAEAKLMLVACSAFVNFALEKARQAELI